MKTILALCVALLLPALVAAQESAAATIRVCGFSAPGFFTRDANGVASGLEYDLITSFAGHSDLRIAFPVGPRSFFGFALPLSSPLIERLSEHLKSLSRSGAFPKMLAKHFGEDNAEMLAEDVAQAAAKP